jgi:hypothetical protein
MFIIAQKPRNNSSAVLTSLKHVPLNDLNHYILLLALINHHLSVRSSVDIKNALSLGSLEDKLGEDLGG